MPLLVLWIFKKRKKKLFLICRCVVLLFHGVMLQIRKWEVARFSYSPPKRKQVKQVLFFCLGVPEKRPSWPIGFRQPFKPQSRFEVLQWEYFTDTSSYGFTEVNPKVRFTISWFALICFTTLWLVKKKTHATLSTCQIQNQDSGDFVSHVFPRLALVTCISFEFLLVHCVVDVYSDWQLPLLRIWLKNAPNWPVRISFFPSFPFSLFV